MVKENQIEYELKNGKLLNINLYEIRLEENLINNKTLIEAFLFDCRCALFLVDMANYDSFSKVEKLIQEINNDEFPYLKKIIVENKSDIGPEIPDNKFQTFINNNPDIAHISISLKTGNNLDTLLNKIYTEVNSSDNNNFPIDKISKSNSYQKCNFIGSVNLMILGETFAGKTNYMTRYTKNSFNPNFLSTTGVEQVHKKIKINNKNYKLTFWDTAGQERYKSIPKKYYQNADVILLLFDINDENSFKGLSYWISDINEYIGETEEENGETKNKKIPVYIIGNKIDLIENGEKREVTKEEGKNLAIKLGTKYYEVSCKRNLNVDEVTSRIILDSIKTIRPASQNIILTRTNVSSKAKKDENKGCCSSSKKK